MTELFNLFLYQPLANILILLYQNIPGNDFGVAIIVLTGLVRLLLYPISVKSIKSQRALAEIQPEVEKVQKEYQKDKERQAKEMLNVYKKAKINPFSGLFLLLVQVPVLLALYKVILNVQTSEFTNILYDFVSFSGEIDPLFLGIINLAKVGITQTNGETFFLFGNLALILGAGLSQFFQAKMMINQKSFKGKKKNNPAMEMAGKMQKSLIYFFPLLTIFVLINLPLAIGLYWLVSSLFSIAQQHFVLKKVALIN